MSLKKMFKDMFIIAYMKSVPDLRRQPLVLLILVGLAAIPLFFIGMFAGDDPDTFRVGLVGVVVSSVGFIAITSSIQDITWDRYVKLREMVVAMPVHPMSYALGISLGFLIFSLPGSVAFIIYGMYLGVFGPLSLLMTLAAMVLCWAALAAMGFTIATYQHKTSPNTLGILANILSFVFVFLPPVYYSEQMLGKLSWISYLLPTSNAAAIIRHYTGLTDPSALYPTSVALHWLILVFTVIMFSVIVVKKSQWREP